MSNATAARPVAPNRRREVDRQPVHEQRRIRAEQARQFELKQKNFIKRAALKVSAFFKKAAAKVASVSRLVGAKVKVAVTSIKLPYAVTSPFASVYRFARKYWSEFFAVALLAAALSVAPVPVAIAALFIAGSYALAQADGPLARFVAHVFFRVGVELFAEGVAYAVVTRNRR